MAIEEYVVGQPVRAQGFFYSDPEQQSPTNVATTTLTVKPPTGADVVYTGSVTHDGLGEYSQLLVPDIAGDWHYRWETTGPVCVVQGMFTVYDRNV